MISNYAVKEINGEEVLYLYFDFDYELSVDDFRNIKTKIEDNIQEFIKKNKISFKGVTVLLLSGGILFGSLNLNTPTFSSVSMKNGIVYEIQENVKKDLNKVEDMVELDLDREDVVDQSFIDGAFGETNDELTVESERNQEDISVYTVAEKNFNDNVLQFVTKSEGTKEKVKVHPIREEEKVEQLEENEDNVVYEEKIDDVKYEEAVDNNIYVSVRRSDGNILKLEIEEYVIGVVGAEMPASFNSEALKAQSIIARTYALKANSRNQILSDNESTQSYKSNEELRSMWGSSYNTYYNKIKDAVNSTKGAYLVYNGEFIDAVYHSTSNGKTESSINVWGNYYPYLVSVDSIYDNSNPSFEKIIELSYDDLSSKLDIQLDYNVEINILEKTVGDRVATVSIGDKIYTGLDFRNKLGLRSTDFDIVKNSSGVVITTRGYGHGVGLSQYGANGMAKNGYSYLDILKHYYSGVSIDYL